MVYITLIINIDKYDIIIIIYISKFKERKIIYFLQFFILYFNRIY